MRLALETTFRVRILPVPWVACRSILSMYLVVSKAVQFRAPSPAQHRADKESNNLLVEHIQLAVNFARNQNLRLVVKNSGHDFNAKSTGEGALSVWTHFLNDIEYLGSNYTSRSGSSGHAFKIGAGVSIEQINDAADAQGLMVVGGIARVSIFQLP